MTNWHKIALAAVISLPLFVGGWVVLTENLAEPWHGYHWNKSAGQVEWVPTSVSVTRRDCVEKLRSGLRGQSDYSEPVGCAFRGNNYWRVWLTNLFVDNHHVRCIARSKAAETGARYEVLIGLPKNTDDRTCFGPIEALFD